MTEISHKPVDFRRKEIPTNKALFTIFCNLCKGCGLCITKCPVQTIVWDDTLGVYGTPTVTPRNEEECIGCGICEIVCPDAAIVIEKRKKDQAVKEVMDEKKAAEDREKKRREED